MKLLEGAMKLEPRQRPRAEDNLGLAYKYAQKFCPPGTPVEDSEVFADALTGLAKAEKAYDPTKLNQSGQPIAFSTCAWVYMSTECKSGYRERKRQNRIPSWTAEEEWQFGLSEDEPRDKYAASAIATLLAAIQFPEEEEDKLQKDLQMLIHYYLGEMTLNEVGKIYGVTKERIRQRLARICEYIRDNITQEQLEDIADVGSYRDGLQRWWKDDFDKELLSRSSAA